MKEFSAKTSEARVYRMAEWTGITREVRRRPIRWLPICAILLATIGFVMSLADPVRDSIGYTIVLLVFAFASVMPAIGPVKAPMEDTDERKRAVRKDSLLVGLAIVSLGALLGNATLIGLTWLLEWSRSQLSREMWIEAMYLAVLYNSVPTLYASRSLRDIAAEDS
jgi:hypothetical protein